MKRKEREELPHDIVGEILERLEAKSLVRLRCVSKQWNSTIKSTSFASRHLIRARDPHVLLIISSVILARELISYLSSWEIKSPDPFKRFNILPKSTRIFSITGSCDGLVCVYDFLSYVSVINPATRWSRSLPRANIQEINQVHKTLNGYYYKPNYPGLGKDTMTGKYKMVWLCNSIERYFKDGPTTCEVFDFDTNTWRHVISSIHSIRDRDRPLYLDGSLYWLALGELKLIRFDLHTEVFQEMKQVPLVDDTSKIVMCCLNNRLCISEKKRDSMNQEIWSLNSDKVWEKTYTVNTGIRGSLLIPAVTVFNKTEMLLLLPQYTGSHLFVIYDQRTGSSSRTRVNGLLQASSYIPSLISV